MFNVTDNPESFEGSMVWNISFWKKNNKIFYTFKIQDNSCLSIPFSIICLHTYSTTIVSLSNNVYTYKYFDQCVVHQPNGNIVAWKFIQKLNIKKRQHMCKYIRIYKMRVLLLVLRNPDGNHISINISFDTVEIFFFVEQNKKK